MIDLAAVREALTGPIASVRPPFLRDGSLDTDGFRRTLDFNIDAGSRSMLLTAGDSHLIAMSDAEIAELTATTVQHTAGRALVVAADRQYHTAQAIAFAKYAAGIGVDVLMLMPPDWARSTTPESLADHYAAVARHIPVMLVTNLYNPRGAAFGLETIRHTLDRTENVVAIKDDVCGEFARKLGLLAHDRCAIFAGGQKQNHLNALPYGCDGYLSTFITFKPDIAHRYWQAIESGDQAAAAAIIRDYDMPFFDFILGFTGGFDAAIHGVIELAGIAERWRPPPYHSLSDADMERLSDFLKDKGLI